MADALGCWPALPFLPLLPGDMCQPHEGGPGRMPVASLGAICLRYLHWEGPMDFHGPSGAFGLWTLAHLLPWGGGGGSEGLCTVVNGVGRGPCGVGPPWSLAGECTGLPPIPEGLQPQQFVHFPFSPDGPALWATSPFLGSRVWVGAPSWAEKGGVGQAVSVSALRASSRLSPASTTPRTRGMRP